jgi:transposase
MTCYVGLDVSLNETTGCVLEEDGRVRFEGRAPSRSDALVQCLRERAPDAARIGMETGQTAGCLSWARKPLGCPWSVWRRGTRIACAPAGPTKPTATTRAVCPR